MIAGFFSLSFGAAGVFLPVLPTTPFVLLAAGCFATGSPRMLSWLQKSSFFGSYIDNYRIGTGVPKKIKRNSIIFLWTGLIISMIAVQKVWITIMLIVIGASVTAHISMLKSKKE